ncbi:hypothetical protein YTPLAS18_27330 [Nitrospira sp.]|nr:hypothetical protein YTPLAS18_27330 [Nitrospira sp.]
MADEKEEDKKVVAPAGVLPIKLVVVIVVGVLLLGIGGAIAFMSLTKGHDKPESGDVAADSSHDAPKEAAGHSEKGGASANGAPGPIFDLDPFVVNLADPDDVHYLKVNVKLELDRPETVETLTARMPQVRDAVLILLSSKDSASIRTAQGKLQLREDLILKTNSLLPKGGVRGAYFTEFIVQ